MKNFKNLKRSIAIILCAIMISNNTLPGLAEANPFATGSEVSGRNEKVSTEETYFEEDEETETQIFDEPESDIESYEESKDESEETYTIEETEESAESEIETTIEEVKEEETVEETSVEETSVEVTTEESTKEENIATDSEIINSEEETTVEENVSSPSEIESIEENNVATISDLIIDLSTQSEIITDEVLAEAYEIPPMGYIKEEVVAPVVLYFPTDNIKYGSEELPSSYDSREHTNSSTGLSYVPPVRQQSPYGSCWAFSTIAAFETSLRIKGLISDEGYNNQGLSEAALLYNTYGLKDITASGSETIDSPGLEGNDFTYCPSNFADRGGNQGLALLAASSYMGVVKENADTSYSRLAEYEDNITEYTLDGNYAFNRNDFVLENAYFLNKANTELIKQKIIENGSVAISYFAGQETTASTDGDKKYMHQVDGEWYYFTQKTADDSNHAIAIVGWDDDIPASYFHYDADNGEVFSATKPGGWLCRNSWGSRYKYSNGGYFWMSYDEPSLASNIYAVDAIKAGTYKYNYHYDTTGHQSSSGLEASETTHAAYANIFKVPEDENHMLEAVSVAVNSANTELAIDVYTKATPMSKPTDGTKKSTTTFSRDTAGIYTIPLEDKVLLNADTYFSIVVRGYSKGSKRFYIYIDNGGKLGKGTNAIQFYNQAEAGQSYYTVYNPSTGKYSSTWYDLTRDYTLKTYDDLDGTYGANYRIKGLANPVGSIIVTFDANGGEGTMKDQYVAEDADAILRPNKFTKTGYKFDKWEDSNGNKYSDQDTININADLSLKATWVPIKYTVNYNANEGTLTETSFEKTYGTNVQLANPTRTGYTFGGWYTENTFANAFDGESDITTTDGDVKTIYAKWTAITYTITYNTGGYAAEPASVVKTYDVNISLSDPTSIQAGYIFDGWYKDENYENVYDGKSDLTETADAITTLYAKWKVKLIYNSNGRGSAPNSVTVDKGSKITLGEIANQTGYEFKGWYKEVATETKVGDANEEYQVDVPQTIYAKWEEISYAINYELDGGNFVDGYTAPTSRLYSEGATLPVAANLEKDDNGTKYKFVGWYATQELSGTAVTSIAAKTTSDKTFYAKWLPVWVVTFDVNYKGEDIGASAINSVDVENNKTITKPTNPTAKGYEFLNWYKTYDASTKTYSDLWNFSSAVTSNMTLYADYHEVKTYTFIFDANGHGTAPENQYVVEGKKLNNPGNLTAEGYTFKYWYENDENTQFNFNQVIPVGTPDGDRTLHAKWVENEYKVTYSMNSGKWSSGFTATAKRKYSESLTLPTSDNIERLGYDFDGWYSDTSITTKITTIDANTAYDRTVYAKWTPKKYNISYAFNKIQGSIASGNVSEYTYGTVTTLPTDVTTNEENAEFVGWYLNEDYSGSKVTKIAATETGDKKYYAKFSKYFTITFEAGEEGTGTMTDQKAYTDVATKLKSNAFRRSGYTFKDWTASNGETYKNGQNIGLVTSNLTLTANWEETKYTPPTSGSGTGGNSSSSGDTISGFHVDPETNQLAKTTEVPELQTENKEKKEENTTRTQVSNDKTTAVVYEHSKSTWVVNPETGKWGLDLSGENGEVVHMANGFVVLNEYKTIIEDNEPKEIYASDTYYFDAEGNMVTGWVQTSDNKWYFFNNEKNAEEGKMAFGWTEIDGSWYFFSLEGDLYQNTITPDGFTVDENGKWVQ